MTETELTPGLSRLAPRANARLPERGRGAPLRIARRGELHPHSQREAIRHQ